MDEPATYYRPESDGLFALMWRAWRLSFTVQGRSRRSELIAITFWLSLLANLVFVVVEFAAGAFDIGDVTFRMTLTDWPVLIVLLCQLPPLPALAARRLHDIGHSGWLALPVVPLCLIAAYGQTNEVLNGPEVYRLTDQWPLLPYVTVPLLIIYLIALLQPAHPAAARYGPDPRV